MSATQRYLVSVDVRGDDECWPWLMSTGHGGHGRFKPTPRVEIKAHRFGWELHFGPIPDGMKVCHSCDNPPCQNPKHWFLGTQQDNLADMRSKGRQVRGERHGSAKLSADQVAEIRARLAAGETYPAIAADYPVTADAIGQIARGERWQVSTV